MVWLIVGVIAVVVIGFCAWMVYEATHAPLIDDIFGGFSFDLELEDKDIEITGKKSTNKSQLEKENSTTV